MLTAVRMDSEEVMDTGGPDTAVQRPERERVAGVEHVLDQPGGGVVVSGERGSGRGRGRPRKRGRGRRRTNFDPTAPAAGIDKKSDVSVVVVTVSNSAAASPSTTTPAAAATPAGVGQGESEEKHSPSPEIPLQNTLSPETASAGGQAANNVTSRGEEPVGDVGGASGPTTAGGQRSHVSGGGRLLEKIVSSLVERSQSSVGRGGRRGTRRKPLTAKKPSQNLTLVEEEKVPAPSYHCL